MAPTRGRQRRHIVCDCSFGPSRFLRVARSRASASRTAPTSVSHDLTHQVDGDSHLGVPLTAVCSGEIRLELDLVEDHDPQLPLGLSADQGDSFGMRACGRLGDR